MSEVSQRIRAWQYADGRVEFEALRDEAADRLEALEAQVGRLRYPFRHVDDKDWSYIIDLELTRIGSADQRPAFWKAVLTEMRAMLSAVPASQLPPLGKEIEGENLALWSVENEREACAVAAEAFGKAAEKISGDAGTPESWLASRIALAIRARKSPTPSVSVEGLARVMAMVEYRGVDNWTYMTSAETGKFVGYARAVLSHLGSIQRGTDSGVDGASVKTSSPISAFGSDSASALSEEG